MLVLALQCLRSLPLPAKLPDSRFVGDFCSQCFVALNEPNQKILSLSTYPSQLILFDFLKEIQPPQPLLHILFFFLPISNPFLHLLLSPLEHQLLQQNFLLYLGQLTQKGRNAISPIVYSYVNIPFTYHIMPPSLWNVDALAFSNYGLSHPLPPDLLTFFSMIGKKTKCRFRNYRIRPGQEYSFFAFYHVQEIIMPIIVPFSDSFPTIKPQIGFVDGLKVPSNKIRKGVDGNLHLRD